MTEMPPTALGARPSCAVGAQGAVQPPPQPAQDVQRDRGHFAPALPPHRDTQACRAAFVQRKGAGAGFRGICHVLTYFNKF